MKKLYFLAIFILAVNFIHAQVNGFTLTDTSFPTAHNLGSSFPLNVSFNWTASTTTSATVVIAYNSALVSYDAITTSLPPCMNVTNNLTTHELTISLSILSACINTSSISFLVYFQFNCPGTCIGATVPSDFVGSLTDNLNTIVPNVTCTANSILNKNITFTQTFSSFNQATAEVTYSVHFKNNTCFLINNPNFVVDLSPNLGGYVKSATPIYGGGYTYTVDVNTNTITPNTTTFNINSEDYFYYVVQLPCGAGLGQTLISNITLKGTNCGVLNSSIVGPIPASFLIPASPAAISSISLNGQPPTSSSFGYTITNTGNTPLDITATNTLPLVHLNYVWESTTQPGLSSSVKYYDCGLSSTTYPLTAGVSLYNTPANTSKADHIITNLLPGKYVSLFLYYNLNSSCNGLAGNPPYKDSISISYNCVAPSGSCITCGAGGNGSMVLTYNPQPIMTCVASPVISGCKNIGSVINLCYEFKNTGDAALVGGIYYVPLPPGVQADISSIVYTGFSYNPTIISATNLKFNLPDIPVGNSTYKICFNAVVQSNAVGGSYSFYNTVSGGNLIYPQNYVCQTSLNICAFAAIGIEKKVKGSLDGSFVTNGNGTPNTNVDYKIIVRNTGTIAVNNLVVIDRIPAVGNLTILGNPNSIAVNNDFNMQMLTVPANSNYTATYTATQNICTGWSGTGLPCNSGAWGSSLVGGGVKFTFTPAYTLAPGASDSIQFQTKIPAGTSSGKTDNNTAGFIATATGYNINPVESNTASITSASNFLTTCATTLNIVGSSTAAISNQAFSTIPAASSKVQFEAAPNHGVINSTCMSGVTVTYIDVSNGSCPINVTRT